MPRTKTIAKATRAVAPRKQAGLVRRAQAEAKSLVGDARRVGEAVHKRAEKVVADFERRAEKLLGTVEARLVKAVAPVIAKTFATRREIRELTAIVEALERKIDDVARRSAP